MAVSHKGESVRLMYVLARKRMFSVEKSLLRQQDSASYSIRQRKTSKIGDIETQGCDCWLVLNI